MAMAATGGGGEGACCGRGRVLLELHNKGWVVATRRKEEEELGFKMSCELLDDQIII